MKPDFDYEEWVIALEEAEKKKVDGGDGWYSREELEEELHKERRDIYKLLHWLKKQGRLLSDHAYRLNIHDAPQLKPVYKILPKESVNGN